MAATRTRKPWSDEERAYMIEHYGRMPAREIAAHLGRTVRSIDNQACKMKIKRRASEATRSKMPTFNLEEGGVNFKDALPPEKHDAMLHFLASLAHHARLAQDRGIRPDIGAYMAEYAGQHPGRRAIDG